MNKKKICNILLSASLLVPLTGCGAKEVNKAEENKTAVVMTNNATGSILTKDETVYVICKGDGSKDSVIVSDWIKNGTKSESIEDVSHLKNVEVVKGDTTLNADGKKLVWDAKKGDVYYQGESDGESLPVSMKITYNLNGKNVAYDDLEGKSGKLTIHIDYENHAKEMINLNGKETELYVPFIMLSGLMADETYSNIKVSNGKVIEFEDTKALMGFALPGLQEDLGFLGESIDVPNDVEITADVKEMTKPVIMTIASNSLFNEVDLDEVKDVNDLKKQMNQLDDGFSQLMDGSSELYNGMTTLMQSSNTLVSAIDQLNSGALQLKNGSIQLEEGAKTISDNLKTLSDGEVQLGEGIAQLDAGLTTLSANSKALNDGATQIFQAVLDTVQIQVQAGLTASGTSLKVPNLTPSNYEQVLTAIIAGINAEDGEAYLKAREVAKTKIESTVYNKENQAKIAAGVDESIAQGKETAKTVALTQLQEASTQASGIIDIAFLKCALETTDSSAIVAALPTAIQTITANPEMAIQVKTTIASLDPALQQGLMDALNNFKQTPDYQSAVNSVVVAAINQKYGTQFTELTEKEQTILIEMGVLSTINETYKTSYASLEEARAGLIEATSKAKVAEYLASDEINAQIKAGLTEATKPISDAISQCDQVDYFVKSLNQYTSGVDTASAGAKMLIEGNNALKLGASQLYEGSKTLTSGLTTFTESLKTLNEGTSELNEKVKVLPEGVEQLTDGSMQLSDGVKKMYDEGISKILDLVDGDLAGLVDRFNAIKQITTSYENYSGIKEGMNGSVKFILKVGE